jgi:hypothetical protein
MQGQKMIPKTKSMANLKQPIDISKSETIQKDIQ